MSGEGIAIAVVVAIVILAVALKGKGKKKPKAPKPAAQGTAPGWHTAYSPGVTATPQGEGCTVDLSSGFLHYLLRSSPPYKLVPGGMLRLRFSITGGGFEVQEFPGKQPLLGLVIQRQGDDLTAQGAMRGYRWFSQLAIPLAAGDYDVTVPLTVDVWGDVFAGQDGGAFNDALAHTSGLGVVTGHDSGRGHGVRATVPGAQLTVHSLAPA